MKAASRHLLRAGQIPALTIILCNNFTSCCFIIPHAVTEPATRKRPSYHLFIYMTKREKTSKDTGRQGSRVQPMPATLTGFGDHPPFLPWIGYSTLMSKLTTHAFSKPSAVSVFSGPKGPGQEFEKYEVC